MTPAGRGEVVRIGDLEIDNLTRGDVHRRVGEWLDHPGGRAWRLVTPNADYVVKANRDPAFRGAVNDADLRVPDGMWIVYASRIAGRPLRASVTGRLLMPALAEMCRSRGQAIGLFGAAPGVAAQAAARLRRLYPGLAVSHSVSPPMGLVPGSPEDRALVDRIAAEPPAVLFVGLGAPRQELWMAEHAGDLPGTILVGVGAGLDLMAGRFRTAPGWMTRIGLEWLFRLSQEPRRLARRYLVDDPWIIAWAIRTRLGA